MSEGASFLPPYISLRRPARWTTALLIASMAAAWVSVGVDLAQLRMLFAATGGEDVAAEMRQAWRQVHDALLVVRLALLAATGALFLTWLHQARVNVRSLGMRRLRFAREWTWAGFLVPLLNLFRPYQVVREIWQASHPSNLDAFRWREVQLPRLLTLWWSAMLAWAGLTLLGVPLELGPVTLPRLQLLTAIGTLGDAAAAIAAFLTIFVVGRLGDDQDRKREALGVEVEAARAVAVA